MLPDNVASSIPIPAIFTGARAYAVSKKIDYEDGPIALQDPSQGLVYQRWLARLVGDDVLLSAPNTPEYASFTAIGMTEFSFTFDQNARQVVAYVQNGEAKLYWFDSSIPGYTTTNFGLGFINPRVTLDDKRSLATQGYQTNDVILAYIRDNNLYWRQQRDRFTIERLWQSGVPAGLIKIGFSRQLRLQAMLEPSR
ncbi:MAG: hypothetical protein ACLGID_13485 [Gammaproteobacteria bacterium]